MVRSVVALPYPIFYFLFIYHSFLVFQIEGSGVLTTAEVSGTT